MQIRIKLRGDSLAEDGYIPFGLLPPRHGLWISLASSLCVHAAGLWAGLTLFHSLPVLVTKYDPVIHRDRVISLDVSPPEIRQVIAAGSTSAAAKPVAKRSRDIARPPASAAKLTASVKAAAPPALATKQFRMPDQYMLQPVPQTLVQLEIPPTLDLHQQLRVPALVILTDASVRRVPPKPFIAPPPKTAPVPMDVAFDMHIPILEAGSGYAKLPDTVKRINVSMPSPAGTRSPVAGQQPSLSSKQAANVTGKDPSEAANIVSLPDHPIPLASAIVLPPVNQVASSLPGMLGMQDGPGATGVNGKPQGNTSGTQASASVVAASGEGTLPKSEAGAGFQSSVGAAEGRKLGPASGKEGTAEGRKVGPTGGKEGLGTAESARNAGVRIGPGSAGSGTGAGSVSKSTSQDAVKLSRSRDGQYGVAVVQSSSGVPGTAGLLKGRPVFSVYLAVGTRKEWILQYCLPADGGTRGARAQVVQLGSVSPVGAPYAFTIVRPVIRLSIGARYGFVHGFVNASGKFEQLSEAGEPVIENVAALLGALEQWEFRPASKDGVPTPVEVLLCIPNPGA